MGTDGQRIKSNAYILASAAKRHAKNIETVHGHTGLSLPNTKALFMRANALRKGLIVIRERNERLFLQDNEWAFPDSIVLSLPHLRLHGLNCDHSQGWSPEKVQFPRLPLVQHLRTKSYAAPIKGIEWFSANSVVCATRQTNPRDRHAKTICFAFVLKRTHFPSTSDDAQGVMQHPLSDLTLDSCPVLVLMVGARACAFPLHHVAETMRPLPIEPVAGMPGFVCGVSVIRGLATPVVDLQALLENSASSPSFGRFVTLKLEDRRVAIGVDSLVGLRNLDSAQLGALPPLLRDVNAELISSFGTRDAQLLLVLRAAHLVPDAVWATLAAAETVL